MNVISTIKEMQKKRKDLFIDGKSVGFVPTMGYLHEGHISLIEQAKQENDVVVVSIFVNPLQFGPNEDFDSYPRDLERDEKVAKEHGADFLFYPSVEEMYPQERTTTLTVMNRVDVLCGASRPGHFDGVATVVMKLLQIVGPDRIYFGLKDAQQVAVVDGLVSDFNVPVEIIPCATVRESDGLAKSSRNVYLSEQERAEAPALFESLKTAESMIEDGERNPEPVLGKVKEILSQQTSGEIDYIEILSYPGLKPVAKLENKIIIAIAVKFNKARLIDNLILTV
ncbi:pantoate--beta-alanine ligase [Pseudalkalibacillus caeni]|uniref:Pantothenate synthetase n=1 Tax=Exobacillus caeni TaxID=2574798 RepID=A0A5R9EXR0_9BACL|nr:pantoate--beta-alanine ligase [Pseudalkalibacillus caeni]TLS35887.1 pantoate--beta-alanine ligase [Pseudalkalibacillus caeni]